MDSETGNQSDPNLPASEPAKLDTGGRKWNFFILFSLFTIPFAVIAVNLTGYVYEKYIRFETEPSDMKLDCLFIGIGSGVFYLVAFPLVGYFLDRKFDSPKQKPAPKKPARKK